jgi:hypothetical protein
VKSKFLSLLIGSALITNIPALAFWQSRDSNYNVSISVGPTGYTGPIDIVANPTVFYALRAGSAAIAAAGTQKLVNLRRASDSVACDFLVASSGGFGVTTSTCNSSTQGGITPTAFAGTDATATCTLATTTATCTGASSTPHVGSAIAGTGLAQPCLITAVGTFTGGAGTLTTSIAGTSTSCGTISVGETFTMTYGLFVTKWYDQSGTNACSGSTPCDLPQATTGNQPQFLPNCGYNSKPCVFQNGTYYLGAVTLAANTASPLSYTVVAEWTGAFSSFNALISQYNGSGGGADYGNSANTLRVSQASSFSATATAGIAHVGNVISNGASSFINVDGTETGGSVSTFQASSYLQVGADATNADKFNGYLWETGMWPVAFTHGSPSSQAGQVCGNQAPYYSTTIGTNC